MAIVNIPDKGLTLNDPTEVAGYLASIDIDYERWDASHDVSPDATDDEILAAYAGEIDVLKAKGGYVTADVINVTPATPGLDEMLARFNREHWHDEDEV